MRDAIRVLPNAELQPGPSTPGMSRSTFVAGEELWMGEVRTEVGTVSDWHHHGEYTTYGCVVEGSLRFEFGESGAETAEAHPGDFFAVSPHTVHRESNPGSTEQVLVVVRVGSGPSVVNVSGPDPG